MNRTIQQSITSAIASGDKMQAIAAIKGAILEETKTHWIKYLNRLITVIDTDSPRFTIIAKGNSKLPFLAFSALPGESFCPGAGDCLQFCYSFRAWRYPAAFARQCQGSWLLQSEKGRAAIASELRIKSERILKAGKVRTVDFRLYVDGDFRTTGELAYWMNTLQSLPQVTAYGYSKSWKVFLQHSNFGGTFADNYRLNLSSGSQYGSELKEKMKALQVTRGEFIAVPVGYQVTSTMHGTPEHNRELRQAYGEKAFTCPGKCGTCTPSGHACGSAKFQNVDIIIAVH